MDEGKLRRAGMDAKYEMGVDNLLKAISEVDFGKIVYYHLNTCRVAFVMDNLRAIHNSVQTFEDMMTWQINKDSKYSDEKKELKRIAKDISSKTRTGADPLNVEQAKRDIENMIFNRGRFKALIRLCYRSNLFGEQEGVDKI
jgi:hypothetical protein